MTGRSSAAPSSEHLLDIPHPGSWPTSVPKVVGWLTIEPEDMVGALGFNPPTELVTPATSCCTRMLAAMGKACGCVYFSPVISGVHVFQRI